MNTVAIVPAAGLGRRMGADKALLDLGGTTAIHRVVTACVAGGCDRILVVRRADAAALPDPGAAVQIVPVSGDGAMADSLRAAAALLPVDTKRIVVFPVDHALVEGETVAAVLSLLDRPAVQVGLPLFRGKPGHPVACSREALDELRDPSLTLRDVIRRDPARVAVVPSANPWVLADLDRPTDLRAARCALAGQPWSPVAQMFMHRSRRAYAPTPLAKGQLARLVGAARHASTSSFIQACSVVAVADPAIKAQAAKLCGDQAHIHQAPVFLAICADLHRIATACQQHGEVMQSQSLELFLQATVDAALVGQNLQLAAEAEGLGSCMIGAARNHPVALAELLRLPKHVYVVFGMTIGHATDDPVPRTRLPLGGVLHDDHYDDSITDSVLAVADELQRGWAKDHNARLGANDRRVDEKKGWADRMAVSWGARSDYLKARKTLRDELRQLGFGLE